MLQGYLWKVFRIDKKNPRCYASFREGRYALPLEKKTSTLRQDSVIVVAVIVVNVLVILTDVTLTDVVVRLVLVCDVVVSV